MSLPSPPSPRPLDHHRHVDLMEKDQLPLAQADRVYVGVLRGRASHATDHPGREAQPLSGPVSVVPDGSASGGDVDFQQRGHGQALPGPAEGVEGRIPLPMETDDLVWTYLRTE